MRWIRGCDRIKPPADSGLAGSFLFTANRELRKKIPDKNLDHYKNLSNYWDTADGTTGIEELEEVQIEADHNFISYVLSGQEMILNLHNFLDFERGRL